MALENENLRARDLKTFVGAKDFDTSREFYVALGWHVNFEEGELAELEFCEQRFYLQRFYQKQWCNNSMLYMAVDDASAWHAKIEAVVSKKKYGAARTNQPTPQDFAKLVTPMWDPSGVLWHLAQLA